MLCFEDTASQMSHQLLPITGKNRYQKFRHVQIKEENIKVLNWFELIQCYIYLSVGFEQHVCLFIC